MRRIALSLIPRPVRRWLIARGIRSFLRIRDPWPVRKAGAAEDGVNISGDQSPVFWVSAVQRREPEVTTPAPKAPREPGRQEIAHTITDAHSIFGARPWKPLPTNCRSALWEELHKFPAGNPRRDMFGLHGDPPLSLICPGCELEQAPLHGDRGCPYCGLKLRLHGSRVFWWREAVEVKEWKP